MRVALNNMLFASPGMASLALPDLAWAIECGLVFKEDGRYLRLMVNG